MLGTQYDNFKNNMDAELAKLGVDSFKMLRRLFMLPDEYSDEACAYGIMFATLTGTAAFRTDTLENIPGALSGGVQTLTKTITDAIPG